MPFPRRGLLAAADPNAAPQFTRENLVNALIIATLSAGALAATLYAPRWPIPCAIIALFIVAFASVLKISLVTTNVITPTIRVVSNQPISDVRPLQAEAEKEVLVTQPMTTIALGGPPLASRKPPAAAPRPPALDP